MDRRLMLARAAETLAAWNRGDADGIVAGVAEDVIWRDVVLGVLHGRDALRDAAQAYMIAFPDCGSRRRRRRWRGRAWRRS